MLDCDAAEASDLLSALVERSLVHRVGQRYAVLETLRQFGAERIDERGTMAALRDRHARHHVDYAQQADRRLRQPGDLGVLDELDASLGDLRLAQRFLVERNDHDGLLRLALALRDYGLYRMRPEVLGWAEGAATLAEADGHDDPRIGEAYAVASLEAWKRGDMARGTDLINRARRAMDIVGQPAYRVLDTLGQHHLIFGRLDEAVRWYDTALATDVAHDDDLRRIETQGDRILARGYAGDPGTAADVDALLASLGDTTAELPASWAWYAAGESVVQTDPSLAAERLQRALDLAGSCGALFVTGVAGASATSIEARHGDPAVAIRDYRWLLAHWQRAGVRSLQWTMLRAVAELLVRVGCHRPAAVLLGAVTSTESGHELFGDDARRLATVGDAARTALGDAETDKALAEGQALDDDDAVAVALAAFDQLT